MILIALCIHSPIMGEATSEALLRTPSGDQVGKLIVGADGLALNYARACAENVEQQIYDQRGFERL